MLVNSIYRFPPQMVFFTTPELLEIGGLPFVSPYDKPTRAEALRYYRKVVDTYDLQIALREKVLSVDRDAEAEGGGRGEGSRSGTRHRGARRPDLRSSTTRSARGVRRARYARNVVHGDRLLRSSEPARRARRGSAARHHYYGEPHRHYRQRVVIVGGGNSAAESALEMYRAGAHVTIVHRAPALKTTIKYWVRPDIENRIKEGSVAARFNACVTAIRPAR